MSNDSDDDIRERDANGRLKPLTIKQHYLRARVAFHKINEKRKIAIGAAAFIASCLIGGEITHYAASELKKEPNALAGLELILGVGIVGVGGGLGGVITAQSGVRVARRKFPKLDDFLSKIPMITLGLK